MTPSPSTRIERTKSLLRLRLDAGLWLSTGKPSKVRSPTERGHEFERMRTAFRGNADSDSSERGHFGGFVVTVSAIVGTVSAIVGIVV
jgi:hypothetical protein